MPKNLKKIDLANALGVDPSMVTRYAQRGMPMHSVSGALEWKNANIRPRVKLAFNEQAGIFDYDNARAKREHFAALMAEAQARKELGELVEVSAMVRAFSEIGAAIRATLEGFPATLSPRLAGKDEAEIFGIMAVEVERVLGEMNHSAQAMANAANPNRSRGGNE